jgi:hypothetical protein
MEVEKQYVTESLHKLQLEHIVILDENLQSKAYTEKLSSELTTVQNEKEQNEKQCLETMRGLQTESAKLMQAVGHEYQTLQRDPEHGTRAPSWENRKQNTRFRQDTETQTAMSKEWSSSNPVARVRPSSTVMEPPTRAYAPPQHGMGTQNGSTAVFPQPGTFVRVDPFESVTLRGFSW